MNSLWDILPMELQQCICEIGSASFIQEIFRKNREWFFMRQDRLSKLRPIYEGKGYRCGDRVLTIHKSGKKNYGTISSLCYQNKAECKIILTTGKAVFYYKNTKHTKKKHKNIVANVIILESWNHCVCNLCKKCDICLFV
jgi:hypothetical protein